MACRGSVVLILLVLALAVAPRGAVRAADVRLPLHLRWVRAALPDVVSANRRMRRSGA